MIFNDKSKIPIPLELISDEKKFHKSQVFEVNMFKIFYKKSHELFLSVSFHSRHGEASATKMFINMYHEITRIGTRYKSVFGMKCSFDKTCRVIQ